MSASLKSSVSPYAFSTNKIEQTSTLLALLLVNKPASELSNESLSIVVQSQDRQQEPVGLFHTYSVST